MSELRKPGDSLQRRRQSRQISENGRSSDASNSDVEIFEKNISDNAESSSHKPLRVGISILGRASGAGDVMHGLKIANAVEKNPSMEARTYAPNDTPFLLNEIASNTDAQLVPYERREPGTEKAPSIDKTEDVVISVCGSPFPEVQGDPIKISIEEFGVENYPVSFKDKKINISTGFRFDPERTDTIQAGIPFSQSYDTLLEKIAEDPQAAKQRVAGYLSEAIDAPLDLEGHDLGMYYVSDLKTTSAYLYLVHIAAQESDRPITIIAPRSHNGFRSTEGELEEAAHYFGFNFRTKDKNILTDSTVTIINPSHLPPEEFLETTAVCNLPSVITGDQSLAEAVQQSQSEMATPFFYYCPFSGKASDFISLMEKIDPHVADIFSTYFLAELPNNQVAVDHERNDMRNRYQQTIPADELARLFYDPVARDRFNAATKRIPEQMIAEREGYVEDPETLIDVNKTVEKVLDGIRESQQSKIEGLIVR